MLTVLGVTTMAVGVFCYAWAFGLSRDPSAPKWVKNQAFASAVCLALVMLIPLGAGLVTTGLTGADNIWDIAGLGEAAVMTFLIWVLVPRLVRRGRVA
jgi:hypothetical protein